MKKVEVHEPKEQKKIMPLVMALANKLIDQLGFVKKINEAVKWDPAHWSISPGGLAKALVLSTFFDIRAPLTHLQDRFQEIDLGYLIGENAETKEVNSWNVGRALERIGEADCEGLYETLALSAIQLNEIPMTRLHGDTTTVSFYGEYEEGTIELTEEEKEEVLRIERGYNKDGRPECKQAIVGQIVNEAGIPIVSRTINGATSDVEWNKEAVQYLEEIASKGFKQGIFIADSKLITSELVGRMNNSDNPIQYVSRCPANFENRLEHRMIEKAYETDKWEELGNYHEGKNASVYHGISFNEEVCGQPTRMLVLQSSSLEEKAKENLAKKKSELKSIIRELEKKEFVCRADAEKEIERVNKLKKLELFECRYEVEERVIEKWPRGRRSETAQPQIEVKYQVKVKSIEFNEDKKIQYIKEEACFVIISNVKENISDYDLLKTYKGQQVVENSFRLLKAPQLASVIYLKNPDRIKALIMILSFSLLIRAIIQYKMREGLKKHNEENPDVTIKAGWGGRPLKNPTFKLFFEHSIHCHFVRENWDHYTFTWPNSEIRKRVLSLLDLMGVKLEELIG